MEIKWIKLSTDIFSNRKIKLISHMKDGDAIIVIWLHLLILAGELNDGGAVYVTSGKPYTEEELSLLMDRPRELVALALRTFEAYGMIGYYDDKTMYIVNWDKYQSTDRMAEIREYNRQAKQRERERKKSLMDSTFCQYCGSHATGYDHIIPISKGGPDADWNKVPCCPRCNKSKKDMPLVMFLNGNTDFINTDIVRSNSKLSKFVTYDGSKFLTVNDSQNDSQATSQHRIDKKRIDKNRNILSKAISQWQTNVDAAEANKEIRT